MIPRRVIGIETEYGITCASTTGQEPPRDPEEASQLLFAPVLKASRSTNIFLSNGARLYLDVGSHPEYATAECDRLEDLLANDRAGELHFASLAVRANTVLQREGVAGHIHLFKNNNDAEGHSFGCHENYLVRRRPDYRNRISAMLPFFVTRQILVGAGHIHRGEKGVSYEFSQRASQMWDAISSASTRSRPMINTRDEPHGDAELYRRMHVIVGDSNVAQASTGLKVAVTEALLTLVEEGAILPTLTLADPMAAIRATSLDLSARTPLILESGGTATPLEIQHRYREAVLSHYERKGYMSDLDPLRRYFLHLWGRVLEALESEDISGISSEIDWAAKLTLIRRYQERTGATLEDPRVARLDLAYHDITSKGLRLSMESQGLLRTLVSPQTCDEAMTRPPQTTRAKLRGDFVAKAEAMRQDYMVDWMNLRLLETEGTRSVILADPFAATDERVDELVEKMR